MKTRGMMLVVAAGLCALGLPFLIAQEDAPAPVQPPPPDVRGDVVGPGESPAVQDLRRQVEGLQERVTRLEDDRAPANWVERRSTWLGVETGDLPATLQSRVEIDGGVYLAHVVEDSPADRAGLMVQDVLLQGSAADRRTALNDRGDLVRFLRRHGPGEAVTFRVLRSGQEMDVPVELGRRPPMAYLPAQWREPVRGLLDRLRERFGELTDRLRDAEKDVRKLQKPTEQNGSSEDL